jgi:acyl-CoA synthetase (AMP-forming)/AMP-acid ligase II
MHLTKIIRPYLVVSLLLAAFTAGCVSVPVQEMSDARQALQAAADVGAQHDARDSYTYALELMREAEEALNRGEYTLARERALAAKAAALTARSEAVNQTSNP